MWQGFQRFNRITYGAESEVLSELLGICTVGLFFGIMLNSTRFLPDGSQTDRHSKNGRRAITMTTNIFKRIITQSLIRMTTKIDSLKDEIEKQGE